MTKSKYADKYRANPCTKCGIRKTPELMCANGYCKSCMLAYVNDRTYKKCEECGRHIKRWMKGVCPHSDKPKPVSLTKMPKRRATSICNWCFKEYNKINVVGQRCSDECRAAMRSHYEVWHAPDRCHIPLCLECGKPFPFYKRQSRCEACRHDAKLTKVQARSVMRLVTGGKITVDELAAIFGWTCQLCNEQIDPEADRRLGPGATMDHIVPLKIGGIHDIDNLQLAHRSCNSKKGARHGQA